MYWILVTVNYSHNSYHFGIYGVNNKSTFKTSTSTYPQWEWMNIRIWVDPVEATLSLTPLADLPTGPTRIPLCSFDNCRESRNNEVLYRRWIDDLVTFPLIVGIFLPWIFVLYIVNVPVQSPQISPQRVLKLTSTFGLKISPN